MPRYGEDQCSQCGAIRAAGSVLCVDCLVKEHFAAASDNHDKAEKIKDLKEKVRMLTLMSERLLNHITSEAVYTTELRIKLLRIERGIHGKNGME